MMTGSDPLVSAMRSGAGLPVLRVLDKFLSSRAAGLNDESIRAHTLRQVLADIESWLDLVSGKLNERIAQCDAGPLQQAIQDYAERALANRRRALNDIESQAETASEDLGWALMEAEFARLHTLRTEIAELHRAAMHLREVSALIQDIPKDAEGLKALDELAGIEAFAAAHQTPYDWSRQARELERRTTQFIRLFTEPVAEPEEDEDLPGTNGHHPAPNGHAKSAEVAQPATDTRRAKRAPLAKPPQTVDKPRWATQPVREPQQPVKPSFFKKGSQPVQPQRRAPAGYDVLDAWGRKIGDLAKSGALTGVFRHAPFWAPIAEGLVAAPTGRAGDLLEVAREVEIDLVDIEMPRLMGIAAGGAPQELRMRIAERAKDITLQEPKRPTRQVFLDWITGKLPRRYRDTAEGLALVESISYALCTDEPWERPDLDYGEIVMRMVLAELERTPAVDLGELTVSLIGTREGAPEAIAVAAERIAASDERVTLYDEGILVRALANVEDPDLLYKLRNALESRLGQERAAHIMRALITAGEEKQ